MSNGQWEKLLSKAQYHLKTAHLFTRTDYTTILPAVRHFITHPRSLVANCDLPFRYHLQSLYQPIHKNGHL